MQPARQVSRNNSARRETLGRSPLNGGHQFGEPDEIEHPPQIIGERRQAEFSANVCQTTHQECALVHPLFDRAKRMLHGLAPLFEYTGSPRQPGVHPVQHSFVLQP